VRILLTIHHERDPDAGAAGVTLALADALGALGHEATVWTTSDLPDRLGPRARELAFPLAASGRMLRAARQGFDVIDASSGDAWPLTLVRPRDRGPLLLSRHHGLEQRFRAARIAQVARDGEAIPTLERLYHGGVVLRLAERHMRRADGVLVLNRQDRREAIALGAAPARVHLVHNGMPAPLTVLPPPAAPPAGTPLVVAQIGSWDPRKGTRDTVAAFERLLTENVTARALLLGTGADGDAVRGAFAAVVRDRIDVVPRYARGDLPDLLADAQVVVQPSLAEGSSLALLEAMACGLVPVATAVGAAPDLIRDGENGLLVPAADPAALSAALLDVARDDAGRLARREAAQRTAQPFSWPRIAADTAALYARLLAARLPPSR